MVGKGNTVIRKTFRCPQYFVETFAHAAVNIIVILVDFELILDPVYPKFSLFYPIDISAYCGALHIKIVFIFFQFIKAKHHICQLPIFIGNKKTD